jgi:hypothetical protein
MARYEELLVYKLKADTIVGLTTDTTAISINTNLQFDDDYSLKFGTGNDVEMNWNGTYFEGPNPTSGMWANCPSTAYSDPSGYFYFMDDFVGDPAADSSAPLPWSSTDDGDSTAYALTSTDIGGVLHIVLTATDNDAAVMRLGGDSGNILEFVESSGDQWWFEARVKVGHKGKVSVFIGLGNEGCLSTDFIADAGNDFSDQDLIGFVIWEASNPSVHWAFQTTGSAYAYGDQAVLTNDEGWHTYGMHFDGDSTITGYIDGTAIASTVDTGTTKVPDGEEMSPLIFIKSQSGSAKNLYVDWVKVVSER